MKTAYMLTQVALTVFLPTGPRTIPPSDRRYEPAVEAVRAGDDQALLDALDPALAASAYVQGHFEITAEGLAYKGKVLHDYLAHKVLDMHRQGLPIEPLLAFREKLDANPSRRAVQELLGFLERGNLPLTSSGNYLAYKTVRPDYTDWHTGTVDNSIGQKPRMARNEVDDNSHYDCSHGYHVASLDYLKDFHWRDGHLMVVEVDPADVVSIPVSDNTKARVAGYSVIAEIPYDGLEPWKEAVVDEYEPEEPEAEEEEEEEETTESGGFVKGDLVRFAENLEKIGTMPGTCYRDEVGQVVGFDPTDGDLIVEYADGVEQYVSPCHAQLVKDEAKPAPALTAADFTPFDKVRFQPVDFVDNVPLYTDYEMGRYVGKTGQVAGFYDGDVVVWFDVMEPCMHPGNQSCKWLVRPQDLVKL